MNLTSAAMFYGYSRFYKLVEVKTTKTLHLLVLFLFLQPYLPCCLLLLTLESTSSLIYPSSTYTSTSISILLLHLLFSLLHIFLSLLIFLQLVPDANFSFYYTLHLFLSENTQLILWVWVLLTVIFTLCSGCRVTSCAPDVHPPAVHHVLAHWQGPQLPASWKTALAVQPRSPRPSGFLGEGSHHTQFQGRKRRRRKALGGWLDQ